MSQADLLMISTVISAFLGSTVLPAAVEIVLRKSWSVAIKRWVAFGVSMLFATAQWYLTTVLTGAGAWEGIALTGPVLFGSATLAYDKYWKGKLGAFTEIDLFRRPDE